MAIISIHQRTKGFQSSQQEMETQTSTRKSRTWAFAYLEQTSQPKAPSSALTRNLHVCWKLSCPKFMLRALVPQGPVYSQCQEKTLQPSLVQDSLWDCDGWGFSCNHTESQLCRFPVLSSYSVRMFLSSPENIFPINLLNTHPHMGTCFQGIQTEMWYKENFMMRIWSIKSEPWENVNMIQ